MPFTSLLPLIRKTKSKLSAVDFHQAVNVAFHDAEAAHYDEVHRDMWDSLSQQMALLAADANIDNSAIAVLDIGCGTGLSSQLLLDTPIGQKISHVTLADTSPNMLAKASDRAKTWGPTFKVHLGDIDSIKGKFDLIVICSVLHHIPDIEEFLIKVSALQDPGGVLLHLQDPNGDHLDSVQYLARAKEFDAARKPGLAKKALAAIPKNWKSGVKRMLGKKTYIDELNDKLLADNVICERMTEDEIWSVTDIHVDGLPYSAGRGISLKKMQSVLQGYQLVSSRSYGFFGILKSQLPSAFQVREQELIDSSDQNGRYISGVWRKI